MEKVPKEAREINSQIYVKIKSTNKLSFFSFSGHEEDNKDGN